MTHEYVTRKIETDGLIDKRKGNSCCVVPSFYECAGGRPYDLACCCPLQ